MDKELLYRKLRRLKAIGIIFEELNPRIAEQISKAYQLLSDPTTNLDIVPRESLIEEASSIRFRMGKTSGPNRDIFESLIHEGIKEDKDLIKRKLRNLKIETADDLIIVASCLRVLRKILSGMSAELNIKEGNNE